MKFFKLLGFGFLLGIAVCNVITVLSSDNLPAAPELIEKMGSLKAAMLMQMLLSGIYGAVCMGSTVLYEADRLPLALISLLHCMICIIPFIPLSLFLNWSNGIADTLIMAGIQLAAYFIVWLCIYLRYRREIKELNEIQKQSLGNANLSEKV